MKNNFLDKYLWCNSSHPVLDSLYTQPTIRYNIHHVLNYFWMLSFAWIKHLKLCKTEPMNFSLDIFCIDCLLFQRSIVTMTTHSKALCKNLDECLTTAVASICKRSQVRSPSATKVGRNNKKKLCSSETLSFVAQNQWGIWFEFIHQHFVIS